MFHHIFLYHIMSLQFLLQHIYNIVFFDITFSCNILCYNFFCYNTFVTSHFVTSSILFVTLYFIGIFEFIQRKVLTDPECMDMKKEATRKFGTYCFYLFCIIFTYQFTREFIEYCGCYDDCGRYIHCSH